MTNPTPAPTAASAAEPGGVAASGSFFQDYRGQPEFYDELLADDGSLRPHWEQLGSALGNMGSAEFGRRWRQSTRLLHENGIAYSSHGDPSDTTRPWELDPLPVIIPESQWRSVSTALRQRAELFNRILADLYGSQNLLRQGLLPAELLFQNPGFWRPLHGHSTSPERHLIQYAADLARAPDGTWWVLGDRTEAPSGAGYALENRIVTSRMLPDAFHHCHVERLAQYFIALQQTVRKQAAQRLENPRIALLSQGPKSANYFEDAYLARYLGYTLVVGEDLTVRNNQVMLKTLEGLLPLHVLLRRPNSEDCDPLELSDSSRLGVPGMLQAVRSGNVSVVNPFGSGIVEAPLMMAFLPRLCQELLGEKLIIPGVATWWCGEPTSLSHVIAHLDRMIVRPAFRQRGHEMQQCQALARLPRKELIETLRARPHEFVAQERVSRSTTPTWCQPTELATESRAGAVAAPTVGSAHIALRAFAVASDDEYYVMNGGLARVSRNVDPLFASLLAGEGSKDVWICADAPVRAPSLLNRRGDTVALRRTGSELPSRVADNVFWLGRHLERADAAARLMRTVGLRIAAETRLVDILEMPLLLRVMAEHGFIEPGYVLDPMASQLPGIEESLPPAAFDESNAASIRSIISRIFWSASAVRDRISVDCWRIIKRIEEEFRPPADGGTMNLSDLLAMIDALLLDLAAFNGLAMESMTRTHTWRFLDLGRRLERSLQTGFLLQHCFESPAQIEPPLLEAVLEICDSLMTYRSRYLANLQLAPVLDLLLTDEINPRSVAYQLASIASQVDELPRDPGQVGYTKHQRTAMSMLHRIRMLDIHQLAEGHAVKGNRQLARFLEWLENSLPELSTAIAQRYLTHARTTHQLSEATDEQIV